MIYMTDRYLQTAEMLSEVFLMCLTVMMLGNLAFATGFSIRREMRLIFFKAPTFLGTLPVPLKVSSAQTTTECCPF